MRFNSIHFCDTHDQINTWLISHPNNRAIGRDSTNVVALDKLCPTRWRVMHTEQMISRVHFTTYSKPYLLYRVDFGDRRPISVFPEKE